MTSFEDLSGLPCNGTGLLEVVYEENGDVTLRCVGTASQDYDADDYTVADGDCDDHDGAVNPGATEVANDIDDDCDGIGATSGAINLGTLSCDDPETFSVPNAQIATPGQVIVYRFHILDAIGCQIDAVVQLTGDAGIVFDLQMDYFGALYQNNTALSVFDFTDNNLVTDDSTDVYIWVYGLGSSTGTFTLDGHW